ncbi:MAG: hypothetical protein Q9172_005450 [Xanthocarpia lactea]
MKKSWVANMLSLPDTVRPLVHDIVLDHFKAIVPGASIDLYDSMKTLSWKILLGMFISTPGTDEEALESATIESLQEDLLRGQFSLMPVSMNLRLWQSPRSKGLEARKKLQSLLTARVRSGAERCPFATNTSEEQDNVASHMLLFTSSLAVKALASLLTAVMLNLYIFRENWESKEESSLASRIITNRQEKENDLMLKGILLETERLSPPVVGIMRRVTQDIILNSSAATATPATLVPQNWDLWLYFVGAARDPLVFGETAESFSSNRYCGGNTAEVEEEGLAFGIGNKSCLGRDLIREIIITVMKTCLGTFIPKENNSSSEAKSAVSIHADVREIPMGVQGWLGWQSQVKADEWAKHMKQLPTQRPLQSLKVEIQHDL